MNTKMPLKEHVWHSSLQHFTWILSFNALKVIKSGFLGHHNQLGANPSVNLFFFYFFFFLKFLNVGFL